MLPLHFVAKQSERLRLYPSAYDVRARLILIALLQKRESPPIRFVPAMHELDHLAERGDIAGVG